MSDSKPPSSKSTPPDQTPYNELVQRLRVNPMRMLDVERAAVEAALLSAHNNVTKAAHVLGIGRTTLYRKMKLYGFV